MQPFPNCIILLKRVHVRICDQVIAIIFTLFYISNLQNDVGYFIYECCISLVHSRVSAAYKKKRKLKVVKTPQISRFSHKLFKNVKSVICLVIFKQ